MEKAKLSSNTKKKNHVLSRFQYVIVYDNQHKHPTKDGH